MTVPNNSDDRRPKLMMMMMRTAMYRLFHLFFCCIYPACVCGAALPIPSVPFRPSPSRLFRSQHKFGVRASFHRRLPVGKMWRWDCEPHRVCWVGCFFPFPKQKPVRAFMFARLLVVYLPSTEVPSSAVLARNAAVRRADAVSVVACSLLLCWCALCTRLMFKALETARIHLHPKLSGVCRA